MDRRWILGLLALMVIGATVHGSIALFGTKGECTVLRPGTTNVFIAAIEEPESGQYIVRITSDGLYVYPEERILMLEANKTASFHVRIETPITVVDKYYLLTISVYKAATDELVESREYCFRVYKGMAAVEAEDVFFGYKDVRTQEGYIYITLYVTNYRDSPVTVYLDSDYGKVEFTMNPVVVMPGYTVETTAKLPVDYYVPEYIKLVATVNGKTKEVTVRMPEVKQPEVLLEVPSTIRADNSLVRFLVRVHNNGEMPLKVYITGKHLPIGVGIYSDTVTIEPHSGKTMVAYLVVKDVLKTGTFLTKVCVKDVYGAELACKYTTIVLKGKGEVETKEEVTENGYKVTIGVENGAKSYTGVIVDVDAPKGWIYKAEPEVFDLAAYEKKSILVYFEPGEGAVDGTAVVRIVAPDGTIIAQKTIALKTSAITGYAVAGASSALGWIIAAIVIALIIALIIKKGKEAEEGDEELEELTKKE